MHTADLGDDDHVSLYFAAASAKCTHKASTPTWRSYYGHGITVSTYITDYDQLSNEINPTSKKLFAL